MRTSQSGSVSIGAVVECLIEREVLEREELVEREVAAREVLLGKKRTEVSEVPDVAGRTAVKKEEEEEVMAVAVVTVVVVVAVDKEEEGEGVECDKRGESWKMNSSPLCTLSGIIVLSFTTY